MGIMFSLSTTAMAYEKETLNGETVLELDEEGNAGATIGMVIYDNGSVEQYDLDVDLQAEEFYTLQEQIENTSVKANGITPKSAVVFHVGIEMVDETDYRMYYTATGIGLTKAAGYMACKSTALLFPTVYHDEYFSNTRIIGVPRMEDESDTFSLPSGTSKVKVGWHDVKITYQDGNIDAPDKYRTVSVG